MFEKKLFFPFLFYLTYILLPPWGRIRYFHLRCKFCLSWPRLPLHPVLDAPTESSFPVDLKFPHFSEDFLPMYKDQECVLQAFWYPTSLGMEEALSYSGLVKGYQSGFLDKDNLKMRTHIDFAQLIEELQIKSFENWKHFYFCMTFLLWLSLILQSSPPEYAWRLWASCALTPTKPGLDVTKCQHI